MTTIAYKNGVLAFDSRVTTGSALTGATIKAKQFKNVMAAGCGDVQAVHAFLDWVEAGYKQEEKSKFAIDVLAAMEGMEFEGILIDRKTRKLYFFGNAFYPFEITAPFYAIGSGSHFAMGAMAMGASAHKAVKVASTLDTATGGQVHMLAFKLPKKKETDSASINTKSRKSSQAKRTTASSKPRK